MIGSSGVKVFHEEGMGIWCSGSARTVIGLSAVPCRIRTFNLAWFSVVMKKTTCGLKKT